MKHDKTGLPRRGFAYMLGALAGAATLPKAVRAAFPAVRQDVITQAEIQGVCDADRAADLVLWNLRQRLEAGATIEPGRLGISLEEGEFDPPPGPEAYRQLTSACNGVMIASAEEVAAYERMRAAIRARQRAQAAGVNIDPGEELAATQAYLALGK